LLHPPAEFERRAHVLNRHARLYGVIGEGPCDPAMSALRIVSYNVRYFSHRLRGLASSRRSLDAIARALAALEPRAAVVCLQEVEARSLRARTSRAPQHDALGAALDGALAAFGVGTRYRGFYFPAHTAGSRARPLYSTGLAVLVDETRLDVAATEAIALTDEGARGERRVCAHVALRAGNEPLHVFNLHLSLPSPLLRAKLGHGANQLAQARRVAAWVRERAGADPFIVCGDFNAEHASPVHRHFTEVERLSEPARTRLATAGVGPLRLRLDYLFGGGVAWLDVDGTRAFGDRASAFHGLSDHVPLIARFALP
jgi:endonuclease/exonuclease/phosphatase family metal-dependent hydrolase